MNRLWRGVRHIWLSRGRLSVRGRAYFNHRLSLFLRSGVPIVTALMYITADADGLRARIMFSRITRRVADGNTLAAALGYHARAFAPFDIALVRIGEASGRLHESLSYAAELIERERSLRARVVGALLYPGLILLATLGIVLFLVLYAFPKIIPLFRGFEGTLPLSTRILIAVSDFAAQYGFFVLMALLLMASALVLVDRWSPRLRLMRHRAQLTLPLVGTLLRAYQLATTAKVLGTLLRSGVGLVPSLELAGEATTNAAYREALRVARDEAILGRRLSDTFAAFPFLVPSLFVQIVSTGEMTGNLSESLLQVAQIYEDEVRERSERIATLVEPVLMIVTGLMVGFIALSIITPIYGITQDLTLP